LGNKFEQEKFLKAVFSKYNPFNILSKSTGIDEKK